MSVHFNPATTLHYLPVPAFVGTYAFEQAIGFQCGNLFFHSLGSYAYPFCEGDCRQGIVLKKQVEDFLPTFYLFLPTFSVFLPTFSGMQER